MAHSVICPLCNKRFDRDKVEYVVVGNRRYAHAQCALRKASTEGLPIPKVENPLDHVTCIYCGEPMHRKETADCVLVSNGKYAHKHCLELEKNRPKTDREQLEAYIMKLFNIDFVNPRIQKQIKQFVTQYNFTESGILKSLKYAYEIKKLPLEKANNGIGIVPHVYQDAFNYYYAIWLAAQKNSQIVEHLSQNDYTPAIVEVHIKSPQRKLKTPKFFSFLDEQQGE